jgi:hypothetical protein
VKHFDKAAHMGTLVVMGQIHIHIDCGDGMLKTVPAISNGDGIAKILYPNFIDRNISKIRLALDVLHISGLAPVMDLRSRGVSRQMPFG